MVRNLERAEDISADAMAAGIEWTWETFPEYLDTLDRLPKGINYAAYIGHSALRTWAMGERAFEEEATDDDLAVMTRELRDALRAGAIGFTTSRTLEPRDLRRPPGRLAAWRTGPRSRRWSGVMGDARRRHLRDRAGAGGPLAAIRPSGTEFCGRLPDLAVEHRRADHLRRAGHHPRRRATGRASSS